MKGIIINEGSHLLDNKYVNACYIQNADLTIQLAPDEDAQYSLSGVKNKSANSCCSKSDEYDFEVGALIALMKLCGLEKSAKAYAEIFDDSAYGDALIEKEQIIVAKNVLNDRLRDRNKILEDALDTWKQHYCDLDHKINALEEENEKLKSEKDKGCKNHQKAMQKKQDRINELETRLSNEIENNKADKEYYEKEIKSRDYKIGLWENSDNALRHEIKITRDALNMWKRRYNDLNMENYELKMDCEKLQHGYIDTDMAICGCRRSGKQHKALVDLFKKMDQEKVDAAYKEAYNTTLPVWQKEFLKQAIEVRKMSKDRLDSLQPENFSFEAEYIDTDALEALRDCHKKPTFTKSANLITLSKREKMWDDILKEGRTPIYVKREDVHSFLEECQAAGIKWASSKMPMEARISDLFEESSDGLYFFVMTSLSISKRELRHVMTWWYSASEEETAKRIEYLPPMRWDLFAKGRLAVKVTKENYSEFCGSVLAHFDKVGISAFNHACKFGYYIFNKDTNYVDRVCVSDVSSTTMNHRKVVDWEDVR